MAHDAYRTPPRLDEASAMRVARPAIVIAADGLAAQAHADLAAAYYGFWNNGSSLLFEASVSPADTDRTLPPGRAQGPQGLANAGAAFFAARTDNDEVWRHVPLTLAKCPYLIGTIIVRDGERLDWPGDRDQIGRYHPPLWR